MKKDSGFKFFAISFPVLILSFMLGRLGFVQAEESQNFSMVETFTTAGGYVGFFNKSDGKVYLYDGDLKECVQISQMKKLGDPMMVEKPLANNIPTVKYLK